MKPGDAAGLARYIKQQAPRYNLDAKAVFAVAMVEGISGLIGDNGTSFGPWQLHKGGAYPSSAPQTPADANAWAWSPAGIDYALGRMSTVAAGQQGAQAVHSIVYRFERPADPAGEYEKALKVYGDFSGSGYAGPAGTVASAVGGAVSGAESVASFVGEITSASFWLRALEVVGGGLVLVLGVYLLARRVGLAPSPASLGPAAGLVA